MANKYMPVTMSMTGKSCLVVGGGNVALRKIEILMDFDSEITVISPEVDSKIDYFGESKKITLKKRPYKSPEASMFDLVISASNDDNVNKQVASDCREEKIPVNVVDNPALCDFIFPAVVKRGILSVAVASDGKAPFFSSGVRQILEEIFPQHWKKLANLAIDFRDMAMAKYPDDFKSRENAFAKFLGSDWKTILKKKNDKDIRKELEALLQ